jgi:hypothetical protein
MIVEEALTLYNVLYEEGLITAVSTLIIQLRGLCFFHVRRRIYRSLKVKSKILNEIKSFKKKGLDNKNLRQDKNIHERQIYKTIDLCREDIPSFLSCIFYGSYNV